MRWLFAVLVLAGCGRAATVVSSLPATAMGPTADELRRDLFAFAADSFRGRETGTPDADRAARWLARRLTELGVEPGGDSGYFHRVPMDRAMTELKSARVTRPTGTTDLRHRADVAVLASLGPGAPLPRLEVDADLAFASYAINDSVRQDLAGLEVRGKVVVVVGSSPPGQTPVGLQDAFNRIVPLLSQGPAGIVLLLPDSSYGQAVGALGGVQLSLSKGQRAAAPARILPLIALAPLRAASPFLPAAWPASDRSGPMPGVRFSAALSATTDTFNGYNVVGIVRGSDPQLRQTFVAYGAHYDHVGLQPSASGDSIANGADDDASGSVTLLALARAWMQGPRPKRSALFVWHIGEEKGLFGSQHFVTKPPIALDSVVAQINADMVGRNSPDSLYIVGPGAAPNGASLVLGALADSANASMPRPFAFDRSWDTQTHPERIYYRSDHYSYAQKGIPVVFFTSGLHPQYHQVTDEAALIDYDKLARVGEFMYRLGHLVANRAERPKPAPRVQ